LALHGDIQGERKIEREEIERGTKEERDKVFPFLCLFIYFTERKKGIKQ